MNKRFFGLDLHKKYATICGISQQGEVVLTVDRLPLGQLSSWATHRLPYDAVALEATANTWWAYYCVGARVGRLLIINPIKILLVAKARMNTDELSADGLAHLLQGNFICEVRVPDD